MIKSLSAAMFIALASGTALASDFVVLGESTGGGASVFGISANGSAAAGISDGRAFRWTPGGGTQYLSPSSWLYTSSAGISADGNTVVSTVADETGMFSAARWTTGTQSWENLGGLPGQKSPDGKQISSGWGVSGDGSTVVGLGWHTNYRAEGFSWTQSGGMVGLGQPSSGSSRASAISADASTVVGFYEHPDFGNRRPVRWTNGGAPDLFLGEEMVGEAAGVNSNGSIICGGATLDNGPSRAFLYTQGTGATNLGYIGPDDFGFGQSYCNGVSDDGSIAVGWSGDNLFGVVQGFVWTPTGGMQNAAEFLAAAGVVVPNQWFINSVTAISADGLTIAGQCVNFDTFQIAGWIATIPAPSAGMVAGMGILAISRRRR